MADQPLDLQHPGLWETTWGLMPTGWQPWGPCPTQNWASHGAPHPPGPEASSISDLDPGKDPPPQTQAGWALRPLPEEASASPWASPRVLTHPTPISRQPWLQGWGWGTLLRSH